MKVFIAIFLTLAVVSIGVWKVFYQSSNTLSEETPSEHVQGVSGDTTELLPSATNAIDKNASVETDLELAEKPIETLSYTERKRRTEQTKNELDSLITEYNEHLQDPEKRAATQARMNILLEEYNKLILPIALAKLDESN